MTATHIITVPIISTRGEVVGEYRASETACAVVLPTGVLRLPIGTSVAMAKRATLAHLANA